MKFFFCPLLLHKHIPVITTATKLTNRLRYYYHITKMSLSNKLAITDVDVKGKRVLVRVSRKHISCPTNITAR